MGLPGKIRDTLDAIRTRRSVRRYKKDTVPNEVLVKILEAGRWAPSGGNRQPWEFIIFADPQVKQQVKRCFPSGAYLNEAPLGILVAVDPGMAFTPTEDGTPAAYAMMLAAHSLGLGTCWVHPGRGFNDEGAKEILGISGEKTIICALSVGYPDEVPAKSRGNLEEIVDHMERRDKR